MEAVWYESARQLDNVAAVAKDLYPLQEKAILYRCLAVTRYYANELVHWMKICRHAH